MCIRDSVKRPYLVSFSTTTISRLNQIELADLFINTIRQDDKQSQFLFTGVRNVPENVILHYGSDSEKRKSTFAYTEDDLYSDEEKLYGVLWDYLIGGETQSVLIYDRSLLESTETPAEYKFKTTPKEALIAVYKII